MGGKTWKIEIIGNPCKSKQVGNLGLCTSTLKSFILLFLNSLHLSLNSRIPRIEYMWLLAQSRDPLEIRGPGPPPSEHPCGPKTLVSLVSQIPIKSYKIEMVISWKCIETLCKNTDWNHRNSKLIVKINTKYSNQQYVIYVHNWINEFFHPAPTGNFAI